MGAVREVYLRLLKVTRCKNCGVQPRSRITTCESGHTACQDCYNTLDVCTKCNGEFFERYHVFYNKVISALNDETNYLEKLYEMLECPVCYENLTCPSWTCWNGHITCGRCYFYTTTCPLCRDEFTNLYNTDINILLSVLESPIDCMNKTYGCEYSDKYFRLRNHEKACAYKHYKCLIGDCEFAGFLSKLPGHVWSSHPKEVIKLDRSFSSSFEVYRERKVRMVMSGLKSYWLISENDSQEMKISLVLIGYNVITKTATLMSMHRSHTVLVSPITEIDKIESVYALTLDQNSRNSKTIPCNITLNTKKSSWLLNTMFVAVLAANLTFAVVILKNINKF